MQDGRELAVEQPPHAARSAVETVIGQVMDSCARTGQTVTLYRQRRAALDEQGRQRGAVGAFLDHHRAQAAEEALVQAKERLAMAQRGRPCRRLDWVSPVEHSPGRLSSSRCSGSASGPAPLRALAVRGAFPRTAKRRKHASVAPSRSTRAEQRISDRPARRRDTMDSAPGQATYDGFRPAVAP